MTSNARDGSARRWRVDAQAVTWVWIISTISALVAVPRIERTIPGFIGYRPGSTSRLMIGSWSAPAVILVDGSQNGAIMLFPERGGEPSGVMIGSGSSVTFFVPHPAHGRSGPPAINLGSAGDLAFLQLVNPAAPESPWTAPRRRVDAPSPGTLRRLGEEIRDES